MSTPQAKTQEVNPFEKSNRRQWVMMAAAVFMSQKMETLHTIAGCGDARFYAEARPVFAGHGFTRSDYREIYRIICDVSRRNRKFTPEELFART